MAATTTSRPAVASTTTPVAPAPPNELGLNAVVDQFREDEIVHQLTVRITNHGSTGYHLSSLQLDWPGITEVPPTPRDTLLAPGQTVDVSIDYGSAVCAEEPPGADERPPAVPAAAVATVVADGSTDVADTAIPVADQLHIFDRVFPSSCRDQRVESAVEMRFGDAWTPTTAADGQPALAGTLEVQRVDHDTPVTIETVGGSVLLAMHAADDVRPALVLRPGAASGQIPLVVEQSGNCAAHALAESKKTFILPVEVVLGDDPPLFYEVTVPVADRGRLTDMINAACGVGG